MASLNSIRVFLDTWCHRASILPSLTSARFKGMKANQKHKYRLNRSLHGNKQATGTLFIAILGRLVSIATNKKQPIRVSSFVITSIRIHVTLYVN